MVKKTLFVLILILATYLLYHYKAVRYGIGQAIGQIEVLYHAEEVDLLLQNPGFPDSTKKQFEYIQEVRTFAQEHLGLNPSENYSTFYDQKGKAILWMVTASPEFEIKAHEWKFPIAGKFSYKGFFDYEKALREAERMQQKNYDVKISEVSAWSTLGFFRDPILSSMLQRERGRLAELIIHELTHATVYRKNQIKFNENFATFVGKEGAKRFLKFKFRKDSTALNEYLNYGKKRLFLKQFMQKAIDTLDGLYSSFSPEMNIQTKRKRKAAAIQSIKDQFAHSKYFKNSTTGKEKLAKFTINNAGLSAYKTYNAKQDDFEQKLNGEFKGNLKAFITAIKEE